MKPTPLTDKFLAELKDKMKSLKLRQTDLATFIGTRKQYVYCWFKRTRNPNGEIVLKIQEWPKLKKE